MKHRSASTHRPFVIPFRSPEASSHGEVSYRPLQTLSLLLLQLLITSSQVGILLLEFLHGSQQVLDRFVEFTVAMLEFVVPRQEKVRLSSMFPKRTPKILLTLPSHQCDACSPLQLDSERHLPFRPRALGGKGARWYAFPTSSPLSLPEQPQRAKP